jgi:ComF family protein
MEQEGGFFVQILDFIFPKRCVGCGHIGKYFCVSCRAKIRPIAPNEPICPMCGRPALDGITHPKCRTRYSLDGLTSFFHYDGPVRKAIKTIKYRLVSDLAEEFISCISANADSRLRGNDNMLIPIPLHPSRFRQRGFNQAEVLGTVLAKNLHIPMQPDILRRVKETVPQVEMKKRDDRLKNMERVFRCNNVSGNVVLFDDVFTTGATMRSAANVLKRGGVKRIWAVTMAR